MVPASDEETESNDVGLHPRKVRKTMSVTKLFDGIRDVLGDRFFLCLG